MTPATMARPVRALASAVALAVVLGACGADTEPVEDADDASGQAVQQAATAVGARANGTGGAEVGGPSTVVRPMVGPPLPDTVDVRYPQLVVRTPEDGGSNDLLAVATLDGVDHFAGVAQVTSTLRHAGDEREVSVLAVEPASFRPLTPEVTANVRGVWERLVDGDVLVRHDIAHALGLELGGHVQLTGPNGPIDVRVGAFASNGAPPLADVIVPWTLREHLGVSDVNLLVVALNEDASPAQAKSAIEEAVTGAQITIRERPDARQAALAGGPGIRRFEPFSYVDLGDGLIVIDSAWVRQWIVTVDLPYLGRTRCHRLMVPQLLKALEQIGQEGLQGHFDPEQFAGCWVPRHIDWDPSMPLSMHAWGLAVDINSYDNCLACPPMMHPRIVEIFKSWGFEWGGDWRRPDGMHFELDRLIEVG